MPPRELFSVVVGKDAYGRLLVTRVSYLSRNGHWSPSVEAFEAFMLIEPHVEAMDDYLRDLPQTVTQQPDAESVMGTPRMRHVPKHVS